MAVNNLGRVIGSSISVSNEKAPGARTKRPIQDYTVTYMIQLDDPCADEYFIGTATGLPAVGEEHPDLPGFFCISREFSETDEPTLWTCTVTFTTKRADVATQSSSDNGGGGNGGEEQDGGFDDPNLEEPVEEDNPEAPPWDQPAEISISTTYVTRVNRNAFLCGFSESSVPTAVANLDPSVAKGTTFNWLHTSYMKNVQISNRGAALEALTLSPMTNSAGEPVWVEYDFPAYNIEITRAVLPDKANNTFPHLIGTLNADPININWPFPIFIPGLSAKYKDLNVSTEIHDDGQKYLVYTQSIEVLPHTGGHRVPIVDQGSFHFDGGRLPASTKSDRVWSVDAEGNPITENLDGAGDDALTAATVWWTIARPVRGFATLFKNAGML